MKISFLILLGFLFHLGAAYGQRQLDEKIPWQGADKILLKVDDTRLIHIDTWQQPEVAITGTVSINANENNEAYQIQVSREAPLLTINAFVENEDSLPQRITVHQDGQDYILNASSRHDSVVQEFIREKGGYDWLSQGVQKDIQMQVRVPVGAALKIESKFGTIEIARVTAPLEIESKFGDIDVSIDPGTAVSLSTDTQFGAVYTNLDWQLQKEGNLTKIKGEKIEGTLNGGGTPLQLNARFGNVFLRAKR